MKYIKSKTKTVFEEIEISTDEIAKMYMDSDFDIEDWRYGQLTVDDLTYFFNDFKDITEKEKEEVLSKIKKYVKPKFNSRKEKEQCLLADRKAILKWLEDVISCSEPSDEGVGFILTTEEVLNLIIKNGKK